MEDRLFYGGLHDNDSNVCLLQFEEAMLEFCRPSNFCVIATAAAHLAKTTMLPSQEALQAPRLVLYIEDNLANIALVEALLSRRQDLTVITARTGKQGVALAGTRQPDVILMDINLPDISGFDALKSLLNQAETADIPVMALSSNAYPRQIEQGIEAGFFRYLTKPFRFSEFTDALDACLALAAERHQAESISIE